ncbi:MAG: chemotaxis protein CheX [Bdellovibrionota bacterium]
MNEALKLPFTLDEHESHYLLKLHPSSDADAAKACLDMASTAVSTRAAHIIVDCEKMTTLHQQWIRTLLLINQKVTSIKRQMRLIAVREPVQLILKQEGLSTSLKVCGSIAEAVQELGAPVGPKSLDVGFINPFLNATLKVLELQCSIKATAGPIFKKSPADKMHGDISGVIGLIAEAFKGAVVITFPEKTFLGVMSRMLGEEITVMNKELEDGAGELTNIIFGQAKVVLNEKGYGIATALPSVITGPDHSISQGKNGSRIVIPFDSEVGRFFVEICIEG